MTTHELPDEPVFAFAPEYDLPDQPQQIRIVFEGMDGYRPHPIRFPHRSRLRGHGAVRRNA